ncbi:MAG: hypothetical protein ACOVOD_15155 [Rhodoferax sp.]
MSDASMKQAAEARQAAEKEISDILSRLVKQTGAHYVDVSATVITGQNLSDPRPRIMSIEASISLAV